MRSQLALGDSSNPYTTHAKGNHLALPVFGRDLSKMESPSQGRMSIGGDLNDHNSYFGLRQSENDKKRVLGLRLTVRHENTS